MNNLLSAFFLSFFCLFATKTQAQAPSNDECSSAKSLVIGKNGICVLFAGTLKNATNSTSKNDCVGQNPIQDVWYKFTAKTNLYYICLQNVVPKATEDALTIEFYKDCNDAVPVYCMIYAASGTGQNELNFFVPNTTYYMRVVNSIPSKLDFTFTIGMAAGFDPPPNDFPQNAIPLTVNPTTVASVKTTGNSLNASSTFFQGSCQDPNFDVWYTFVATSDRHHFEVSDSTPFTGTRVGIFEGTANNLKWVACLLVGNDKDESTDFNLTIGKKYYVQFLGNGKNDPFSIAITTPPSAADNDYFTKPQTLSVNPSNSCSKLGWGTTLNASPYSQPDLWYKFKATATTHKISFHNVKHTIPPIDIVLSQSIFYVYGGGPTYEAIYTIYPPGGVGLPISDFKEHRLDNLTIGTTYYVKVANFNPNDIISFEVCLGTDSQKNDSNMECQNALQIPTNPTREVLNTLKSNTTLEIPHWFPEIRKSWYYFTATNPTHIFIEKNYTQINKENEIHEAFLYPYQCPLVSWQTILIENKKVMNNLVVGDKYFITLEHQQKTKASYELAITTPIDTANNTCDFSKILEINNNSDLIKTLIGDFSKAKIETLNTPCEAQNPTGKSLWYAFDALAPQHEIQFEDAQKSIKSYEIWEGVRCNSKQIVYCSISGTPFGGFDLGKKYYLRVISDGDKNATFKVGITTNNPFPKNDDCKNAIDITPSNDGQCSQIVDADNFNAKAATDKNIMSCNQYGFNNDIWFSFVAKNERQLIKVSDLVFYQGQTTDLSYEILENDCTKANNKPIHCIDNPTDKNNAFNFQVGKKYYLRFYGKSYNSYTKCKFKVCITKTPTNDTPEFAEEIPAQKNPNPLACPKTVIASTVSSTYDPYWKFSPYYCKGMDNIKPSDVWFKTNLSNESKGFWFQFVSTPSNSNPIAEAFVFENNKYVPLGSICGSDTLFTDKNGQIFIRIWDGKKDIEGNYEVCLREISKNPVAVNDSQNQHQEVTIYPNPANDILYFDLKKSSETYAVRLFSIDGVLQLSEKNIGNDKNSIDIHHLQSGTYIVLIENKTSRIFKKAIKI